MAEKPICPNETCKSDKIMVIKDGLAKCLICGTYLTPANPTRFYRQEVMTRPEEIKELATKQEIEVLNLSDGQWKFVNAVANKLTYAPEMKKHYRTVLIEVFAGKREMQDVVEQIVVEAGMREDDLKKLMDEELQKIPEAVRELGKKSLFT